MPPKQVKTIRQLIYWEYAKLISGRAVGDRKNYRFVMHCYKQREGGRLHPSSILRENKALCAGEHCCAYCQATGDLDWEHIIPKSRGGPETIDNWVQSSVGLVPASHPPQGETWQVPRGRRNPGPL